MADADPLLPQPYRVARARREGLDTTTLEVVPLSGSRPDYLPGQFNMLYAFGIGEVAISVSGRYFMNSPTIPGQKRSGEKAATRVSVAAITGPAMRRAASE